MTNPNQKGKYLLRYRWYNRMNKKEFDQWIICEWDQQWKIFSGAIPIDWKAIES